MKYLGIDYGTRRIGLAVSDDEGKVAFPLEVVEAGREALSKICDIAKEKGVGAIVIGESRNYSGEKNEVMEDIEQFKKDIGELMGLPVEYQNEVLSSAQAARQFTPDEQSPSDVGRPRASRKANPSQDKLDAAAAALILQSYLDTLNQ